MSVELKPCTNPECRKHDTKPEPRPSRFGWIKIQCTPCGMKGPRGSSVEAAAALWNVMPRGLDADECAFLEMIAAHLALEKLDIQSDAVLDIARLHRVGRPAPIPEPSLGWEDAGTAFAILDSIRFLMGTTPHAPLENLQSSLLIWTERDEGWRKRFGEVRRALKAFAESGGAVE